MTMTRAATNPAADPAGDNVEKLIVLTEQLTRQMALDAQAFEARRPHEVAARVDETGRLANLYRHESARVRQDPRLVAGATREQRLRLVRASEAFDSVLARHGRALYGAKVVTEGIVRAIAEEIASARTATAGYGPAGRTHEASGAAITLNRTA